MDSLFYGGLALIIFAGTFSGIFSTPFNKNKEWKWENNWLVWSFVALIICPWIVALATVPDLFSLYAADGSTTLIVALLGLVWGIGAVLFGKGIDLLGVSLAIPIMQGLISSIGSLVPFWMEHPTELFSSQGQQLLAGVAVIVIGIILFSLAGKGKNQHDTQSKKQFKLGMLICILAGVLGPMINFGFVFGQPLQDAAIQHGTAEMFAANPVWSILLTTGFITNALQCVYLLKKNHTTDNFKKSGKSAFLWAALAGIFWYVSIFLYGMGCNYMTDNASSIGWAVMQAMSILASNFAGIYLGEWKDAPKKSLHLLTGGLVCLILGIVIISC